MLLRFDEFASVSVMNQEDVEIIDHIIDKFIDAKLPTDNFYNFFSKELNLAGNKNKADMKGLIFGKAISRLFIRLLGIQPDGMLDMVLSSLSVVYAIEEAIDRANSKLKR